MTIEIIILALASTVRPTSLAAVTAILASAAPRRLMALYTACGLAFTVAVGLLVIWAFNGIATGAGHSHTKGVAALLGGLVVLAFGAGVASGHLGGPHGEDAPAAAGRLTRWAKLHERRLSARTAALAGPATHIPGLFYLVALNIIIAHRPRLLEGLVEVLLYNAIWFTIPILALVVCVARPDLARQAVARLEGWTRAHLRTIAIVVSLVVGGAMVVQGLLLL